MKMSDTRSIDGVDYEFTMYSATKGAKMLSKLTRLIGEPLAMFADEEKIDKDLGKVLPLAMRALSEKLDDDVVVSMIKDILAEARVGGNQVSVIFDTHFAGRYGHLFKVVGEMLSFQYGDLKNALGALGVLKPKAQKPSKK